MEFINGARLWSRRWSTWLAGLNAALWASITAQSGLFLGFIPFLPPRWQWLAVVLTFVVTFIAPVLIAQVKQPKLKEKADAAEQ
jgi:hypothetical protein